MGAGASGGRFRRGAWRVGRPQSFLGDAIGARRLAPGLRLVETIDGAEIDAYLAERRMTNGMRTALQNNSLGNLGLRDDRT